MRVAGGWLGVQALPGRGWLQGGEDDKQAGALLGQATAPVTLHIHTRTTRKLHNPVHVTSPAPLPPSLPALQVLVAERGPLVFVFNFSPHNDYEGLKVGRWGRRGGRWGGGRDWGGGRGEECCVWGGGEGPGGGLLVCVCGGDEW